MKSRGVEFSQTVEKPYFYDAGVVRCFCVKRADKVDTLVPFYGRFSGIVKMMCLC